MNNQLKALLIFVLDFDHGFLLYEFLRVWNVRFSYKRFTFILMNVYM